MSRTTAMFSKAALSLALLLVCGPAHDYAPAPLTGIRTALELIANEPGRAIKPASLY